MDFNELQLNPHGEVDIDPLLHGATAIRIHPSPGFYHLTVEQQIQQLEDEYKDEYIKPARVPYNRNMARHFPNAKVNTVEELKKKRDQAEASRLSRDRNKYYRSRMEQDIEVLTKILEAHMKRLTNMKNFANEFFVKSGIPPFDFSEMWNEEWSELEDGHAVDSGCSTGTGSGSDRSEDYDDDDNEDDEDDDNDDGGDDNNDDDDDTADDDDVDEDNVSDEEEENRFGDSDEYMDDEDSSSSSSMSPESIEREFIRKIIIQYQQRQQQQQQLQQQLQQQQQQHGETNDSDDY